MKKNIKKLLIVFNNKKKLTIESGEKKQEILLEDFFSPNPFWSVGDYIITKKNISYIKIK